MYRTPAIGKKGLVVSGHPLATSAGLKILQEGGNAADAAIAVSSVLSVVLPSQNGIGGDFFALYYDSSNGKIKFLNASGYSGSLAKFENLPEESGIKILPKESPYSITVPGITYGWYLLSSYSTMKFEKLLSQSIDYAENGFPISYHLSSQIFKSKEKIRKNKFLFENFSGKMFGETVKNLPLAQTLKKISENPLDFYNGETFEKISEYLEEIGSFIIPSDLKNYKAFWDNPIKGNYRKYEIFETPPNTQGIAALVALKIMENYDVANLKEWENISIMVMAKIKAFQIREMVTDPKFMKFDIMEFIENNGNNIHESIKRTIEGDTVNFAIIDKDGNAISGIQSLFYPFGSGYADEKTGVIFQNRGAYFSLSNEHPNFIQPNKRTLHTLTAGMIVKDEELFGVFGAAGGEGQPQTHIQIIHNIIDRKMNPQEIVEYPRFVHGRILLEGNETLKIEENFEKYTLEKLSSIFNTEIVGKLNDLMGDANIIIKKENVLMGGSDPRRDSMGLGF
ncbi:MAG: gamma-glutamyltransferase family protein [Thermoplasmata archaeon]